MVMEISKQKFFMFFVWFFLGVFINGITCDNEGQKLVSSFVPMTCSQNLYTQYHNILFCGDDDVYCSDVSVTYRYMESHNDKAMAIALWGDDTLVFSGSKISPRSDHALIAEYFGMGVDTNFAMSLSPHIQNQIVDCQIALSGKQFWFQLNFPIMYANWRVAKNCRSIPTEGFYDAGLIDGSALSLRYAVPTNGVTPPQAISYPVYCNDIPIEIDQNGSGKNNIWFEAQGVSADGSFVGTLKKKDLLHIGDGQEYEKSILVSSINTIDNAFNTVSVSGDTRLGVVPIGLYGQYYNDLAINTGVLSMDMSVDEVHAAPAFQNALEGNYPFGRFHGRQYNNFSFAHNAIVLLADIPIMFGCDFVKEYEKHIGAYIKFVIPTGTQIDHRFLRTVFSPVCGNGHHFECGVGYSAHVTPIFCDEYSWGIYGDGYVNAMFGAMQFRSLDLLDQPMSRYALAYEYTNSFSVNKIISLGDTNIVNGYVSAIRGECILQVLYQTRYFKMAVGYAFAGQSAESLSQCKCVSIAKKNYAIVGNALQNAFAVGPVLPSVGNGNGIIETALVGTDPYQIPCNFYNLGPTNTAVKILPLQNSAYDYGVVENYRLCQFSLPEAQVDNHNLMPAQILNRIFAEITYCWIDALWMPEVALLGSYGGTPPSMQSNTASYWDLGFRIGCYF